MHPLSDRLWFRSKRAENHQNQVVKCLSSKIPIPHHQAMAIIETQRDPICYAYR